MNSTVLFRTYQPESGEIPLECKIWEATRATSAAPTFFKCIVIGNGQPFINAGIGCNNPSSIVWDEAKALFGAHQIGCFLSIGTGWAGVISIPKPGFFSS